MAFDADPENLEVVRRDYPLAPISVHPGSVRQLVEGHHFFGDMHFVHAGGLLDTLPDAQATRLVSALFAMLQPGGTLVVCTLLEGLGDSGYAEAYMDWHLVCRTRPALEALATGIAEEAIGSVTWLDSPEGTLGALAIERRRA